MPFLTVGDIYETACEVRNEFTMRQVPKPLLAELYLQYDPDVATEEFTIDDFINRGIQSFPREACGLASLYLAYRIGVGDVRPRSYDGKLHTFVMLSDIEYVPRLVADVTADQFGGPEVYVGTIQEPWEGMHARPGIQWQA